MEREKYTCFVIIPFTETSAPLWEALLSLETRFSEFELEFSRADTRATDDELQSHIENVIRQSHLCLADITDPNPNVFMEVGFAAALGKSTIFVSSNLNEIPSSLAGNLVITFDRSAPGFHDLICKLTEFIPRLVLKLKTEALSRPSLTRIFPTLSSVDLASQIHAAVYHIDILQTNLTTVSTNLLDPILAALERNDRLQIRILTLDPDSPFSIYRSRQLAVDFSLYRHELLNSLNILLSRLKDSPRYAIRIFDDFPTQIAYRIDDLVYWSVVARQSRSRTNVTFLASLSQPSVAHSFLEHFESLWALARPYIPTDFERDRTGDLSEITPLDAATPKPKITEGTSIRITRIPYYYGTYISDPDRFFGRARELATIVEKIGAAADGHRWHISVVGDYRAGKSSLLKRAEYEIESRTNSLAAYFDLSGLSAEHFMTTIIKRLIDITYAKRKTAKSSLSRMRELLKSGSYDALADLGIDVDLVGVLKLKLNPKQSDHWQDFSAAVTRAVKHVRDAEGYRSIVLILDEVNAIAEWEEFRDILVKLRAFAQETDGLNLLVGSPHSLYELTKNEWSPFYNIFYKLKIGPLDDSEADELIRVPASPSASSLRRMRLPGLNSSLAISRTTFRYSARRFVSGS
jgi:hypothetical protein